MGELTLRQWRKTMRRCLSNKAVSILTLAGRYQLVTTVRIRWLVATFEPPTSLNTKTAL